MRGELWVYAGKLWTGRPFIPERHPASKHRTHDLPEPELLYSGPLPLPPSVRAEALRLYEQEGSP